MEWIFIMGDTDNCTKLCVTCTRFDSCIKTRAANDNDSAGVIFLPSNNRLKQRHVPHRLAFVLSNIVPVQRHKVPDFVTGVIWSYKGVVIGPDGKRIDHLNMDAWDEFNAIDGDASLKWYDDLLAWRDAEPKLSPRASQLRRFRTLFLAIAILNPRIAARLF